MKTNNKGFSLVELIVVIAIMAILAAVAIPTFASFITKANKAADDDFMAGLEYAINLANTTDPDFDLDEISVSVNAKGEITKVAYKANDVETEIEVKETDTAEPNVSIASVIDWDYKFKATKGTDAQVAVVTVTFEDAAGEGA